ncbi:MAG: hypothetical protein K6F34_07285 [Lachnospiraceae bacterium]|nr:hypothetical protein [Lachnospiraceae bacterium]
MGVLANTVSRESKRIEFMIKRYGELKAALPKGTIVPKKIGNQTYYYLKYRDGDRVVSDYIHKDDLEDLTGKIEHRKHIELMIKSLKDELATAKRLLRGK